MSKQNKGKKRPAGSQKTDSGRRKLLIAGAGGLGVLGLAAAGLNLFKSPSATTTTVPTPVSPASTPIPAPTVAVNLPPLKPVTLPVSRANAVRAADEII